MTTSFCCLSGIESCQGLFSEQIVKPGSILKSCRYVFIAHNHNPTSASLLKISTTCPPYLPISSDKFAKYGEGRCQDSVSESIHSSFVLTTGIQFMLTLPCVLANVLLYGLNEQQRFRKMTDCELGGILMLPRAGVATDPMPCPWLTLVQFV